MGLFDTQDDNLKLDPKAVQQSLSRLNSMRPTAPPAPPAPVAPKEKSSLLRRAVADPALGLLKGAIGVPEFVVGLADIATGGYAGKGAEALGFKPKEAKEIISSWQSPELNQAREKVGGIKGFVPTVKAMAENPSTILDMAAESAPSMIGAGGVARGALKMLPKLASVVAAGLGEGLVSAGQTAEQVRQSTSDGLLTPKQMAAPLASGALTALIGVAGGKVANKLGIADVDTMLATGQLNKSQHGLLRRVAEGVISEGVLEELPQSAQEQVAQNVALNKPWNEGVANAAASGMMVGGVMGGGSNVISGRETAQYHPEPVTPTHPAVAAARAEALEALALAADPTNDLGVSDAVQAVNQRKAEEVVSHETPVGEPTALTPEPVVTPEPETPAPSIFEAQMSAAAQDGGVALSKREEGPTPEMHQWAESNGMEFTPGKLMPNMEQRWWGLQQKQDAEQAQIAPQKVTPSPEEQAQAPPVAGDQSAASGVSPAESVQAAPQEATPSHTPPPAGEYRQHVVQRDEQGRPLVVVVERPDGVVGLLNTKGGVTAAFENATDPDHPYIQAYREAVARGEVDQGPAPNAAFVRGTQQFDGLLQEVAAQRITPRKTSRATATFKELSSVDSEEIPSHVVNAVAAPREVMTAVGTATKQQTKDTLNTFLSSGDLSSQNPIRLTTVEELHDIIKNGTLRPGKDFEGRSGISAQLVDGKKPIVAYGPNDKISAAIVFPEHAAVGKGMAPNEVKVSEKTDVADLRFVVDGFRALMSFGELKEAVRKTTPREEKKGGAAADQGTAKNSLKGFEKWPAARRLAVLNTHYRNARGESLPAGSFRESGNRALRDSLAKVARIFGHDVTLMERGPDGMPAGFAVGIDRKNIYIQEGVSDHPLAILGHEMVHQMKASDPALFDELAKGLMALRNDPAMEMYLQAFDTVDASTVEEWVADVFGNTMTQEGFWSEFEKASPSLAGRVAKFVHDLINRFKDKLLTGRTGLAAQTIKDFRAVERLTAEVARRYAENVKRYESGEMSFKEMTAWHGSPHDHDKFSMEKIGTGEGAQAYGYGLYFAGNRAVAEWYRDRLSGGTGSTYSKETRLDLKKLVSSPDVLRPLWDMASHQNNMSYDDPRYNALTDDIIQEMGRLNVTGSEEVDMALGDAIQTFDSFDKYVKWMRDVASKYDGKLYQVELAPQEDEYLLWDKPLSEQSEKVKEAIDTLLADLPQDLQEEYEDRLNADLTEISGGEAYKKLLRRMVNDDALPVGPWEDAIINGETDRGISEYLHSLGIRGIKYLDGSSRGKGDGNYNYVIFDDNDVTITFKELTSLDPKEQAKGINRAFRDIPYGRVLKDAMKSAYRFFMPMDRTVNLLASMANYKPIQTQLKQFLSQRKGKAGYLQAAMTNAHHVIKTMGKAFTTEADEKKLADLAFTSTLYQVHADPRMADGWTEDSWVTSGQDQVTGKSLDDARREVRAMYNALTPAQKKAHRAMLDHFQHLRDDAKNHALDPVKQLFGEDVFAQAQQYLTNEQQIIASGVEVPQLVKDAAKAIKTKMQAFPELKGDYVPLMRFGNYQARINEVDENGEMGERTYAEFFDTKEDALRFIAGVNQNTAASGQMATLEVADDKLRRAHVNVPGSYADQIKDALQNKYKEALESGDADTQALIESMIEAAHDEAQAVRVNTLPRTTTEGSKLHREGVAGFSRDIVKVFATYSRNNALANSRLIYGEQINQTFRDMKNTIKAFDSEPSEPGQEKQHALMSADMQDAYNWLYRMDKEGDQEKVHELAQMLGKASAFWYLSSPSTWMVQWSQPFIFTVPHMAARFGFPKALAEYTKAAKRYMSGNYSDEKIDEFDRTYEFVGKRMADLIEQSRTAPERERRQINAELKSIYESFTDPKDREMLALKVLSHQNAVDLSAAHMVQDLTAGATDGTKTFDKLVNGSAWFMQHSESGSRRAAAVSSFNMAFGKDGDFLKANDYAVDTISKTLYDFDSSNRGEAWRGSWGRVFGIFRFFQLHTIGQITQLSKDALGVEFKRDIEAAGNDQAKIKEAQEKRSEARKELAYIMGSSFALAGALGTPLSTLFSNSAMNLIWAGLGLAFGDDDDPWDPRRDFEMMVRKNMNSTAADVVLKGLPSLVGADVSRRIGLGTVGDLINGEPPPGISSAQKFGWYAGRALGPAGGMVMDGVRVLDELEKGNLTEAIRYGTPKGIRDMVKAFQVATEGVKSGGNTIMKGEDVSPYSFALMFLGVNPLDVSLAQEESRYLKNISAVLSQRRSGLVKDLAEAVVNQDEDAKAAAVEEINGWQQAHPKLAITAQQVVQAIKRRQKAEENVPTKREQIIQEEYGQEGGEGDGEM